MEKGRIPGAVVVIARRGRVAFVQAAGFRDPAARAPMTPDAIFRIASMTKPMVTVAALSPYEEGRLFLADPVSKYIPAFKGRTVGLERASAAREMTIQDLMRHTSGLTCGNRGKSEIYKMYPESSNEAWWADPKADGGRFDDAVAARAALRPARARARLSSNRGVAAHRVRG